MPVAGPWDEWAASEGPWFGSRAREHSILQPRVNRLVQPLRGILIPEALAPLAVAAGLVELTPNLDLAAPLAGQDAPFLVCGLHGSRLKGRAAVAHNSGGPLLVVAAVGNFAVANPLHNPRKRKVALFAMRPALCSTVA